MMGSSFVLIHIFTGVRSALMADLENCTETAKDMGRRSEPRTMTLFEDRRIAVLSGGLRTRRTSPLARKCI